MRLSEKYIMLLPLVVGLLFSSCTKEKETEVTSRHEESHAHEESNEAAPGEHGEGGHEEETNQVVLTPEQAKMADIKTGAIQQRVLGDVLRVNGIIDVPPDHLISVSTPYGGTVKSTELLEGTKVKKGQVLAVLQNPEFLQIQQQYLEAKAQLDYLKAEYERKQLLYKEEVASQKSFQAAKAEFSAQQIRVNTLAEQLKLIGFTPSQVRLGNIKSTVAIRSTSDAIVKTVHVNVGRFVQPMEVLFELVDPRHQHVELTVYQQNVDQVKPGQRVLFSLPGESKMERKATVYLVGNAIGEEKSIRVHAHPENESDPALRPGAYVQALVETGSKRVPSVPVQAIVEFEEKNYLFVRQPASQEAGNQTYKMVPVQKGLSESGYTEVQLLEGTRLDSTAQVVIEGAYALLGKLKNKEEEGGHGH